MIDIYELSSADGKTLRAVNELIPQLSQSASLMNEIQLRQLVESEATKLFFAQDKEVVLGMLSLVIFSIPTGTKA